MLSFPASPKRILLPLLAQMVEMNKRWDENEKRWEEKEKFKTLFTERPTNAVALNILARKLRYLNCSVYDTLLMP